MAIPSTASRWQPAPPTDGEQQNQGLPQRVLIPRVVLRSEGFSWLDRLWPRSWFFLHHEHIARNGSGPRSGGDANAQRKRPTVASTVRLLLRLPLRGAPSEGAASLHAPGLVSENTPEIRSGKSSPAENSRSPDASGTQFFRGWRHDSARTPPVHYGILFPELIEFVQILLPAFLRLERTFVEVRKVLTFLLVDGNGEAVAVFVVAEDAIHGKQELVTLRPVPAFYHGEADLHSFVIEDDVLNVSNLFVLRPINIRATYVRNVRGKTVPA